MRSRFTTCVLSLAFALMLSPDASGGIIALNESDASGSASGIRRFDTSSNALSDFATGVPGYQSLDFDAATGNLYALWGGGRVASFDSSGTLLGDVALSGFSLTADSGADISVHDGIIALNESDVSGSAAGIRRFDTSGNALSDFATGVSGYQSLDFDAATGNLYALWGSGRVASFNSSGALLGDVALSGYSLTAESGADISVHNGIVALNESDAPGSASGIRRYDTSGNALSDFATGVAGYQSLDFDATTGHLHALWGSGRVASFDSTGVLLGDVALSGYSLTADSGADIAVLTTAVPEPSGLALMGLAAMGGIAARRRRNRI